MTRLVGKQKITGREAAEMRERFATWPGPSGDFVAAEAERYRVGRETIRRILRRETHLTVEGPTPDGPPAFPWAGTPTPAPSDAAEADARRLLESLSNPSGDAVVEAFREAAAAAPAPTPGSKPPDLNDLG